MYSSFFRGIYLWRTRVEDLTVFSEQAWAQNVLRLIGLKGVY